MFAEAIEDILRNQCTPEAVRRLTTNQIVNLTLQGQVKRGNPSIEQKVADDAFPLTSGEAAAAVRPEFFTLNPRDGGLWDAIVNAGFLDVMRPVEQDGAGLSLAEVEELIKLFGYYAAPLPFSETIAARALVAADATLPDGMLALAPTVQETTDGGWYCSRVPFGAVAGHVLSRHGDRLLLLACAEAQRGLPDLPGGLTTSLHWPAGAGTELDGDADGLAPMAAALTAAQMAGSMRRVMEMTLEYCNARSQFGRTLGKFQAIQHQLSVMAEHTLAVSIAVAAAFHSGDRVPARIPAAMAKARAGEAAVIIANTAHGLHGAIGVTEEYDLQLHTRRLHDGRLAHGSEKYWHRIVGEHFLGLSSSAAQYVRKP